MPRILVLEGAFIEERLWAARLSTTTAAWVVARRVPTYSGIALSAATWSGAPAAQAVEPIAAQIINVSSSETLPPAAQAVANPNAAATIASSQETQPEAALAALASREH